MPAHEAIRRARQEGHDAVMLPGVSAEDCLVADLGFDPGARGCQSFEATDFLVRHRRFDPASVLLLWQIGGIGVSDFRASTFWNPLLARVLAGMYGDAHEVVVTRPRPSGHRSARPPLPARPAAAAPVTIARRSWCRPARPAADLSAARRAAGERRAAGLTPAALTEPAAPRRARPRPAGCDAESIEQALDRIARGDRGDAETLGDSRGRQAGGEQAQDVPAPGQAGAPFACWARRAAPPDGTPAVGETPLVAAGAGRGRAARPGSGVWPHDWCAPGDPARSG
jgi:hypothetical protein